MPHVRITDAAEADIEAIFAWWVENRSADQAATWYTQLIAATKSLSRMPERCPLVPVTSLSVAGVRHLLFGVGSRPTHRIIFVIQDEVVAILRVRRHAQEEIGPEDLFQP